MRANVLDFGAVADGKTLNTEAVSRAVAALAEAGGGELYFPAGEYLSGSIELIDHLTIVLEQGAVLRASPEIADFYRDPDIDERLLCHYFLYAMDRHDVAITGSGVLDGSGAAFWQKEYFSGDTDETLKPGRSVIDYNVYKPLPHRPVVLYLAGCSDIRISGITIRNAPAYTVWLVGCRRASIDSVTIRNPRNGPNTDALDIDCSQQVRIVNCDIDAGDDCIALKSDPNRLGRYLPCERIVVADSILSSSTCAVRIGYEGDAPIRDVVFGNLVIYDSRHGIDILSIAPVCAMKIERGTPVENIRFENIVMRNVGQAFFIWAGNEKPRTDYAGFIRNLSFAGMTIESVATSYIGTDSPGAISDLRFTDIVMHVADLPGVELTENPAGSIASHWGGHWKSGGLRLRGVPVPEMTRVRIVCDQPGREAIVVETQE